MRNWLKIGGTIIGFFILWELFAFLLEIPTYLLPRPTVIFSSLFNNLDSLLKHAWFTSVEIVLGFFLALLTAIVFSVSSIYSRYVDEVIFPLLVVIQVVPKIALAPLFLIWMGYGLSPKIIITALVCFFPIVISLKKGLDSVGQNLIDIMRSMGRPKWEIMCKIQLPSALPHLFSGLRIGIAFAAVGAVAAEFVVAKQGLGYQVSHAATVVNTPLVFAALFLIALLGMFFYFIIILLEKKIVFWERKNIFG